MWSQAMGLLVATLEKVSKGTLTLSDVVSMIQSSLMLMGVPHNISQGKPSSALQSSCKRNL